MSMKYVITLISSLIFFASAQAQQQVFHGWINIYDPNNHLVIEDQNAQMTADLGAQFPSLKPGQTYGCYFGEFPYTPVAPPAMMPSAPPSYITDCSKLVFSDQFNGGNTSLQSELSQFGPITGAVKWQTACKADGSVWSLHGFQTAVAGSISYVGKGNYYDASKGYLELRDLCWIQDAANWQWQGGMNNWYTPALCSASYASSLGGGTNWGSVTGSEWKAPFYFETYIWMPQLMPWDAHWASGLWPSVSFYPDPTMSGPNGVVYEYDLFELYSVNYGLPHCTCHVWKNGSDNNPGTVGSNFPNGKFPDLSLGWHKWGIWVDTATITWYLDDVAIFSAPNPNTNNIPMYVVITPAMGGSGWQGGDCTVPLTPSVAYEMQVSYVACWSH